MNGNHASGGQEFLEQGSLEINERSSTVIGFEWAAPAAAKLHPSHRGPIFGAVATGRRLKRRVRSLRGERRNASAILPVSGRLHDNSTIMFK